jgi:hypothetical protein
MLRDARAAQSSGTRKKASAKKGKRTMEVSTILPYAMLALGGAVGGNILGLLTRGGGGLIGRTVIGALAGVGAGYAAVNVPQIGAITSHWGALIEGENGTHLANFITGGFGGAIVGLVTGLLLRPRA